MNHVEISRSKLSCCRTRVRYRNRLQLSDDGRIHIAAARILHHYRAAFMELAK